MTQISSQSPRRILLVDDDDEHRRVTGLLLASEGYTVSQAQDGNAAVLLHRQHPFDLVIVELFMDKKDGFQTLVELRQDRSLRFIATAKTSHLPADLCRRMAKHLGAHSVLNKPFQGGQLLAAVRQALT